MSRLILLLLMLSVHSLFAGPPLIEMTCEHATIPQTQFVIAYVTLHNKTSDPIDVITCLPNIGTASRGGNWIFMIQSSIDSEESEDRIPIKARLLPATIPPNGAITFSERIRVALGSSIDDKTHVECKYKVSETDAKRYNVWGGVIITKSVFVPFYKAK